VDLDVTVRELAPKLLGYCTLRTGDRGVAEEVAQDALTALVQRWRRYGSPHSPAAFVFAIARRRCGRAMLRKRLLQPLDGLRSVAGRGSDPETDLIDRDERRRLVAALGGLRRKDRDLLLLLAGGELRVADVAAVLGVSLSAVKMRASRARHELRQLLESNNGASRPRSR